MAYNGKGVYTYSVFLFLYQTHFFTVPMGKDLAYLSSNLDHKCFNVPQNLWYGYPYIQIK